MPLWTLEQACNVCARLQKHLASFGYGVGLTGGVLFHGESDKDIDLIIFPLKRTSADFTSMYQSLSAFGLEFIRLPNNNLGYSDDGKHVEVWEFEEKRIDLFFLT